MKNFYNIITLKHIIKGSVRSGHCLLLFILFFSLNSILAQEVSRTYKSIVNSSILTSAEKQTKVDRLFDSYRKSQKKELLALELRIYVNWIYSKTKDYKKAIIYAKESAAIYEGLNAKFKPQLRKILYNLGHLHYKIKDYQTSNRYFQKVILHKDEDSLAAKAYSRMGINIKNLGDFYKAIRYHDKAKALLVKHKMHKYLINDRIDASNVYRKIGSEKSMEQGIQSLLFAERIKDSLKIKISSSNSYKIYSSLGNMLNGKNNSKYPKAIYYYRKALSLALTKKDSIKFASTLNHIGILFKKTNKDSAIAYFRNALLYSKQNDVLTSRIDFNISDCLLTYKELEEALLFSKKAFAKSVLEDEASASPETATEENFRAATDKWLLLDIIKKRASIWLELYKLSKEEKYVQNSLKLYFIADKLIDLIRFESTEQNSKLFWRDKATDIYINATKACYALNDTTNAFYFMEKNKAVLLIEDISFEKHKTSSTVSEKLITRELTLKNNILLTEEYLRQKTTSRDSINDILFDQKERYAKFIDSLKFEIPAFYYLKKPAEILTYNATNDNEVLVEYIFPGKESLDENGYGLWIEKDHRIIFKLPDTKTLNSKLVAYKKAISKPFNTVEEKEYFNTISNELFFLLFPKERRDFIENKKMTIIADGMLQNIPLEALVTNKKSQAYLINSCEIRYAYSQSFLKQNQLRTRNPKNNLLTFAPIEFQYEGLTSLPKSKDEILTIGSIIESKNYIGNEATSDHFLENSNEFKILHLATHADASDSITPWIAFNDRKLALNELYTIRNQAELVVLSACNTSLGKVHTGEGVMSLARVFFSTGANSVVSSLWNVDDAASSKLLTHFYKEIEKGNSKSKALRQSKLSYLKSASLGEASPYYWASFILIGDAGPIETSTNLSWVWYIIMSSVLLLIFFLSKRKIKNQK